MSDPAPAPAPAPAPSPAPSATWYDGFDAETKGYISNKGLDRLEAPAALEKVIGFHRNAERMLGAPHDQLVRLPKDAGDTAARQNIFTKLGKPANANEYKFEGTTFPDQDAEKTIRDLAFKYDLTQDQAAGMARDMIANMTEADKTDLAATTAAQAQERKDLQKDWGFNFNANMEVARAGALRMGLTQEQVGAMEKQLGYKALMEGFHKIGVAFGEDKFVTSQHTGKVMTVEGAKQRLNELKADRDWSKRYLAGGANEKREMADLMQIAYGKAS